MPVKIPVAPTVALPLVADHTPPVAASDKVICNPAVTLDGPLIVPALSTLTETTETTLALPQLLVAV